MIKITHITVALAGVLPHPGTDFRLIEAGETGLPDDEYFDSKDGAWKPMPPESFDPDEPFDPEIHAPTRRKRGPKYIPYDRDSIPLPLVVRSKLSGNRFVISRAYEDAVYSNGMNASYQILLNGYTHDEDGTPCGIKVSDG